jgi:hypothetical protein
MGMRTIREHRMRASTAEQVAGFEMKERELRAAGDERLFAEQTSSVATRVHFILAADVFRRHEARQARA